MNAWGLRDEVSATALLTLKARVVESRRSRPILADPVGVELLEALGQHLASGRHARVLARRLPPSLTTHIALRARYYDRVAERFLAERKDGLVVDLGAGFDTRYWRIGTPVGRYVEVDLPDVVAMKRRILGSRASQEMIGCSVLDDPWLDRIASARPREVLFLAEGLFMYLPRRDVTTLFAELGARFDSSEILFEVVNERYTRGIWKRVVRSKMRRLGTDAGAAYDFGVRDAREVESFGPCISVVGEWSYFEDPEIRPGFLHRFRNSKVVTRTQWTIRAAIGGSRREPAGRSRG